MKLFVRSRRKKQESIVKEFDKEVQILDVTSRGPNPWIRFSPFYAHGEIPVPLMANRTAQSVEGIWQGLKVFESSGIDESKFDVTSGRGLKRTVRKHGRVVGHQKGNEEG